MRAAASIVSGLIADRYAVERAIGEGATATVYLARDTRAGTAVAIKLLREELAQTAASARFLKEIRQTAALNHPRILPVLDSGEHEGLHYLVLPYAEGGTLRDRLRREKQLPIADALGIIRPVADALDYAHQRGLIHRDVKPENILFIAGEPVLADFGIARALQTVLEETSTSTGIVRGTPAYMSPEQASGSKDLDGRSDIYSLACVLYEMLAGVPAFIGPTPEAVIAQRFAYAPREIRAYRSSISPGLEAAIAKALTISVADRYATATEFVATLESASSTTRTAPAPMQARKSLWNFIGVGAALLVLLAAIYTLAPGVRGTPATSLDTTLIALMPIESDGRDSIGSRDDVLLQLGVARWTGVTVADPFQIADAIRRSEGPLTSDRAARLAADVGAGRFVRTRASTVRGERTLTATMFDAATARPLHTTSVRLASGEPIASGFERLADSLLLRDASEEVRGARTVGTRSIPAIQAFADAHAALAEWDLASADSALQTAMSFAPEYARASLWLAQVRAWRGQLPSSWASLTDRALAARDDLGAREGRLATALAHIAAGRYASACAVYDTLVAQNDRDFAAWFGRGQCRTLDKVVVADRKSPSGWRFRSSAHTAMKAYSRAVTMLPSVHHGYEENAFQRLRVLLLTSNQLVTGYGERDSAVFYARPGWMGDSLVLVAYPRDVMVRGGRNTIPPGFETAIRERREEFRRVAAAWSAAYRRSAGAKQAVSLALEQLGDVSAIDTLRVARSLATDPDRVVQLAASEVILLAKFGIDRQVQLVSAASAMGDSLLRSVRAPTPEVAQSLARIAVLLRDCAQATALLHAGGLSLPARFSAALYVASQDALVRAALGCDTGSASVADIMRAIDREQQQRSATPTALLDGLLLLRPALLSTRPDTLVLLRLARSTRHLLAEAALANARGDRAEAVGALRRAQNEWVLGVPTPDFAAATAMLWLAVGDTSAAQRVLDQVLSSLPAYEPEVFADVGRIAGLVRVIQMGASLAAAHPADSSARNWTIVDRTLRR